MLGHLKKQKGKAENQPEMSVVIAATPSSAQNTNTARPTPVLICRSPYPMVEKVMKPGAHLNKRGFTIQEHSQKYIASPKVQCSVALNIKDPPIQKRMNAIHAMENCGDHEHIEFVNTTVHLLEQETASVSRLRSLPWICRTIHQTRH
jgi:hypothetical protein